MTNQTSGGFTGDLAEAFAPPAAGGCCGAPATSATSVSEADQAATSCCGSPAAAQEAAQSGCCGQAPAPAAAQATGATGTGCCG